MRQVYSKSGWIFVFHRISGLILFFYFLFHIIAISTALVFGEEKFNSVMALFNGVGFKYIEFVVVACVIGHGINGLHMIFIERGWLKSVK